jgi:hypothetical protein
MKFDIEECTPKVTGSCNFGLYLSNVTPTLHEAQIELHRFSHT